MKFLLRLYPRSWRARYIGEMEDLVDQMPSRPAMAVDLLFGAAAAYVDVVRANRILSAAGAFLHGVCVAVLLQAIAFVTVILVGHGSRDATDVYLGPFHFITVYPTLDGELLRQTLAAFALHVPLGWLPPVCSLVVLLIALGMVLMAPRMLRAMR